MLRPAWAFSQLLIAERFGFSEANQVPALAGDAMFPADFIAGHLLPRHKQVRARVPTAKRLVSVIDWLEGKLTQCVPHPADCLVSYSPFWFRSLAGSFRTQIPSIPNSRPPPGGRAAPPLFSSHPVPVRSFLMQNKLITLSHPSTDLEDLIQRANDLIRAAKAPSTRKAYQSDFRIFESWCAAHRLASLPSAPETIALYIASCVVARLAPATIARRLASISKAHQAAGFENSPASTKHFIVGQVLKGARRTLGVAQNCIDPLLLHDICRLLAACPENLLSLRDRALILIGFAGAFRRSELCAMAVADLCFSASGLVINVPRSKADQEQAGDKVAIPFGEHEDTCPIKALREWLSTAKVTEGAVFRGVDRHGRVAPTGLHRDSIAAILKTAAARAGMNATNIAGHSVRAGMATQAALNGSSERAIAKTTRHKSRSVLRRYICPGELFRENASASLGL